MMKPAELENEQAVGSRELQDQRLADLAQQERDERWQHQAEDDDRVRQEQDIQQEMLAIVTTEGPFVVEGAFYPNGTDAEHWRRMVAERRISERRRWTALAPHCGHCGELIEKRSDASVCEDDTGTFQQLVHRPGLCACDPSHLLTGVAA